MARGAAVRDHAGTHDGDSAQRALLVDDPNAGVISASAAGLSYLAMRAFGVPLVALLAGAVVGHSLGEAAGIVGAVAGAVLGVATLRLDRAAVTARLRLRRQRHEEG